MPIDHCGFPIELLNPSAVASPSLKSRVEVNLSLWINRISLSSASARVRLLCPMICKRWWLDEFCSNNSISIHFTAYNTNAMNDGGSNFVTLNNTGSTPVRLGSDVVDLSFLRFGRDFSLSMPPTTSLSVVVMKVDGILLNLSSEWFRESWEFVNFYVW